MTRSLDPLETRLADLYYSSGSARFDGPFEFSVHRDNPNLEKSPSYLHYPQPGEPGSEYLPELYQLAGLLIDRYITAHIPLIEFERIAAVPSGAIPLAEAFLDSHCGDRQLLLTFAKTEGEADSTAFDLLRGRFEPDDRVLIIDDHTSGGRNKKLMKATVERLGLRVADIITVVNRQQGGVKSMAAEQVSLHALLTLDDILQHGLRRGYISASQAELTRGYVRRNQFSG